MSVCVEARAESPRGGTSHYLAQNLVLYRSSGVSRELGPTPAPRHAVGGCGTNGTDIPQLSGSAGWIVMNHLGRSQSASPGVTEAGV